MQLPVSDLSYTLQELPHTEETYGYILGIRSANEQLVKATVRRTRAWLRAYVTLGEVTKTEYTSHVTPVGGVVRGKFLFTAAASDRSLVAGMMEGFGIRKMEDPLGVRIKVAQPVAEMA